MLLNPAQLVVLIVSRLYWLSADCRSQNWVGLRQFYAFVEWIFIAEPRFFKKPCRPATYVAENFRFGKVKVVTRIHAVCCHEWRLNVAVPYCRAVLLESGGELPRGLPCVITGTVLALGSVNDRGLLTRVDTVFDSHQSAAECSCWTMGNSDSIGFEEAGACFRDVGNIGESWP